uniref:Structural maintenance of chromosomes protein n=1 Tax=Meloidogyne javanica TaxID=6303 RepID=A0A915MT02_MELJA
MSRKLKARNLNQLETQNDNEQIVQDRGNEMHVDFPARLDDNDDLLNMEIPPLIKSITYKEGCERLVISHIQVDNFKSYFGKRIIGPFHKCFTSIIGPNGSGKSNVIDALLFVFGYRASKIRSKKVSVLIHSSAGKDGLNSCTVAVHFCKINDNLVGNGYTKVHGSDIEISLKFKEIGDLLRANGIDLVHNRFLILQGEVEQISMMKPKAETEDEEGMLEYLEDIIGSSRLKPLVLKLHRRIEQLNERRALQLQRVQHAEKEKNQLDGPVREVLKLMRLENALTCLNNKILLSKRLLLHEQAVKIKEQKNQLENELAVYQQQLNEILQIAKQISKERQKLQNILDKCDDALQSVRKKKANQEQVEELESVPERSRGKIEAFRKQLEEMNSLIEEFSPILMAKLQEVREALKSEEPKKTKLEEELGELSIKEDSLNSKLTLAQQRLLNLQSEEEEQRQKFDALQADLLRTEETVATREKKLQTAQAQLPELEATFEGKTSRLAHLHEQEARFTGRIRELRRKYEEQKQTEECYTSANKLLNRIMEAKRNGEIQGIFGRLGDLGAIDEKYDSAISVNFPQLEYIVTDTIQTAQQCIELLKREQLGVSTFIALDKQQQYWRNIRAVPKTPENAPRLFDLIRVKDEHVLPAFYYVLGETLVADDIISATRIAMGNERRWRTVTLKGELVDVSGAMTGGGNVQARSRIGREVVVVTSQQLDNRQEASTQQQLAELQQELNNAEAELTNIKRQHAQLEPELQKRRDDLKQIRLSVREMQLEIENSNIRIIDLRKQIEIQKQNVVNASANPEEVKNVKAEITSLTSKTTEIGKQTDKIRSSLMAINARMEEVDERIAGPHRERLRDAEERKKEAENGITKESAAIITSERNLKKSRAKIANLEKDVMDVEKQFELCTKNISTARDRLVEYESQLLQCNEDLDLAKQKLNEFISLVSDNNEREVELQRQVSQLQHEVKRLTGELATLEAKLRALSSKANDGLDSYLEECIEQEETEAADRIELERKYIQIEIDENSGPVDEPMEQDLVDDDVIDANLTTTPASQNNLSNLQSPNDRRPHNSAAKTRANPDSQMIIQNSQCFIPLPRYTDERIREFCVDDLETDLATLEQRRAKQRVNLAIVMDFMQKLDRYEAEFNRLSEITSLRDRHRALHDKLKKQRLFEFMEGFQEIATLLRTTYQMITILGDVSLELVDALDPFSEGIAFNVRPPKKSWKQILNLSGGEKTLASLSLVFALHHYKPTPLYVMDEIDAALDFRNVSIIANYLLERTRNAQFIVISLRNQMYEKSDRLIGIYKINDCTGNVCLDRHVFENKRELKYEQLNT